MTASSEVTEFERVVNVGPRRAGEPGAFVLLDTVSIPERRQVAGASALIYVLVEDGECRYVGATRYRDPERRLDWHMRNAPAQRNRALRGWLMRHLRQRTRPGIRVLEVVPLASWEAAETHWIGWFRRRGALYNIASGGDSFTVAYSKAEKLRRRIRLQRLSKWPGPASR